MKQRLYLLVLWKIDLNFYILNLQKKKSYFLCRENDGNGAQRAQEHACSNKKKLKNGHLGTTVWSIRDCTLTVQHSQWFEIITNVKTTCKSQVLKVQALIARRTSRRLLVKMNQVPLCKWSRTYVRFTMIDDSGFFVFTKINLSDSSEAFSSPQTFLLSLVSK